MRSDKKMIKHNGQSLARLSIVYDALRKQFMLQGSYANDTIDEPGVVHSALDIFEPLPETAFTIDLATVANIRIYSEATIQAIEFTLRDHSRKMIGQHDWKVIAR